MESKLDQARELAKRLQKPPALDPDFPSEGLDAVPDVELYGWLERWNFKWGEIQWKHPLGITAARDQVRNAMLALIITPSLRAWLEKNAPSTVESFDEWVTRGEEYASLDLREECER